MTINTLLLAKVPSTTSDRLSASNDRLTEIPRKMVADGLAAILKSDEFCQSPRMSRLLCYLVEKELNNTVRDLNEYTIAEQVFDRDPGSYHPAEDPIVRVQTGRLREKLRAFHAQRLPGGRNECVISLPKGTYRLLLSFPDAPPEPDTMPMNILPITCISDDARALTFVRGLNEELSYRVFQEFGPSIGGYRREVGKIGDVLHVLEGSVRWEPDHLRVTFRIRDVANDMPIWCKQLDLQAPLSIQLQEKIAIAACDSLRHFYSQSGHK